MRFFSVLSLIALSIKCSSIAFIDLSFEDFPEYSYTWQMNKPVSFCLKDSWYNFGYFKLNRDKRYTKEDFKLDMVVSHTFYEIGNDNDWKVMPYKCYLITSRSKPANFDDFPDDPSNYDCTSPEGSYADLLLKKSQFTSKHGENLYKNGHCWTIVLKSLEGRSERGTLNGTWFGHFRFHVKLKRTSGVSNRIRLFKSTNETLKLDEEIMNLKQQQFNLHLSNPPDGEAGQDSNNCLDGTGDQEKQKEFVQNDKEGILRKNGQAQDQINGLLEVEGDIRDIGDNENNQELADKIITAANDGEQPKGRHSNNGLLGTEEQVGTGDQGNNENNQELADKVITAVDDGEQPKAQHSNNGPLGTEEVGTGDQGTEENNEAQLIAGKELAENLISDMDYIWHG